jgi:hypothetical protein
MVVVAIFAVPTAGLLPAVLLEYVLAAAVLLKAGESGRGSVPAAMTIRLLFALTSPPPPPLALPMV